MSQKVETTLNTLFTTYVAGFNHGANEGPFPKHGVFEAFERFRIGESPTLDSESYNVKDKIKVFESSNSDLKASIYFWAYQDFESITGYKHTQEIAYDDVFTIAEEISNKGLNVMIQISNDKKYRTLFVDDRRFTQR